MRRLRALIMGLPPDAAVRRHYVEPSVEPVPVRRSSSSLEEIRKIGGKVIEIHREAG